jgi:hypothetical protein
VGEVLVPGGGLEGRQRGQEIGSQGHSHESPLCLTGKVCACPGRAGADNWHQARNQFQADP